MDTLAQYLDGKRKALLTGDYKKAGDNHDESCLFIALEVAKRLRAEAKEPYVVRFLPIGESLRPLMFQGRVLWLCHIVCCCDGIAYDPLCASSIPVERYASAVFGEELIPGAIWSSAQIEEILKRGQYAKYLSA